MAAGIGVRTPSIRGAQGQFRIYFQIDPAVLSRDRVLYCQLRDSSYSQLHGVPAGPDTASGMCPWSVSWPGKRSGFERPFLPARNADAHLAVQASLFSSTRTPKRLQQDRPIPRSPRSPRVFRDLLMPVNPCLDSQYWPNRDVSARGVTPQPQSRRRPPSAPNASPVSHRLR